LRLYKFDFVNAVSGVSPSDEVLYKSDGIDYGAGLKSFFGVRCETTGFLGLETKKPPPKIKAFGSD
jgi:hypothetical protein